MGMLGWPVYIRIHSTGRRTDLEAAAVGDDGAVPVDELVEAPALLDHLGACVSDLFNRGYVVWGLCERSSLSPIEKRGFSRTMHPQYNTTKISKTTHTYTHTQPTGLEEEVVGVAERQLLPRGIAPVVVHCLERAVGRHGHEADGRVGGEGGCMCSGVSIAPRQVFWTYHAHIHTYLHTRRSPNRSVRPRGPTPGC